MARLYAYKCIQAEERKLQEQFENLPINGRKTTRQTIKRIQGQRVVLGEASIILPDCTIVGFEKLKEIELNYKG